ncbi:MAG TPA: methylated-DNA--[protein]-cysteine S-methyltransferase [Acidimicrobiales bacterium]|nr:methylated-DNA--[protein]-cysteine S-methyltransferase [Acidimicrobiales bacterium]
MELFRLAVTSRVGRWGVEGTAEGLTRVYMPTERFHTTPDAPSPLRDAAAQLGEYFAGTRRHFELSLGDVAATNFQRDVWSALRAIPYGEVRTYAQVADQVRRPRAMRAVGNANHANPWPVVVPCHRVVARHGLGGYGGGPEVKRFLLELEGYRA